MVKKNILLLISILTIAGSIAQNRSEPDQIKDLVGKAKEYLFIDVDSSIYFAKSAIFLAEEAALLVGDEYKDIWLSNIYNHIGFYEDAIGLQTELLNYHLSVRDLKSFFKLKYEIARIHSFSGNFKQAREDYQDALEYYLKYEQFYDASLCYAGLGQILLEEQKYEDAVLMNSKALNQMVLDLGKDTDEKIYIRAVIHNNIGIAKSKLGKKAEAIIAFQSALEGLYSINRPLAVYIIKVKLASLNRELGNIEVAENLVQEANDYAHKAGDMVLKQKVLKELFEIANVKKQYQQALRYHLQYSQYEDSLYNRERIRELGRLETEHMYEKEKAENERLLAEQERQEAVIRSRNRTIIIFSFTILILTLIFGFFYLRALRRRKRIIEIKVDERTAQLKEAMEKLDAANKELQVLDVAKNSFLQMISHEIRTPLNGIVGAFSLLKDIMQEQQEMKDFVHMLEDSVDRLEHFSTTALIITQMQADYKPDKEKLILEELLKERLDEEHDKIAEKKLDVTINADEDAIIHYERGLIAKAIDCIVDNAVSYSEDNGKVQIDIITNSKGVIMEVRDEGKGFSKEVLEHKFKPFELGEEHEDKSIGLSLKAVKHIMEVHGGTIELENPSGEGALVRLIF